MTTTVKERPILFRGEMVRAILAGKKTQTRRVINFDRVRIKPRYAVHSDIPGSQLAVSPRWHYAARMNPHGAISVSAQVGADEEAGWIGLKPGEFDFVCPYADGETILVSGEGWRVLPAEAQRLWVRENFVKCPDQAGAVRYAATDDIHELRKVKPSIHMPRWACRLVLEVVKVRVERLQSISEGDAIAEGIQQELVHPPDGFDPDGYHPPGTYGYVSGLHQFPKGMIHPTAKEAFEELWHSIHTTKDTWEENPWLWVVEFKRVA